MRLVLLACLVSSAAWAQVPVKLAYQGRLIRAGGAPENGVVSMAFSLHTSPTIGAKLWTEVQQVNVQNGYYAVFLGEATPLLPVTFDGQELYLEVSVDGTPLLPRQRIASVAYAIRAGQAAVGRDSTMVGDGLTTPLGINDAQVQRRVTQTCPVGTFMTNVLQDGTVTCAAASTGTVAVTTDATMAGDGAATPLGINSAQVQRRILQSCTPGTFITNVLQDGGVTCGPALTAVSHNTSMTGDGAGTPLAMDPAVVQTRVSQTCGVGSYITAVAQNGTVTCGNALTAVSHNASMTGNGAGTPLAVDPAVVQTRVSQTCGAGSFMTAVAQDGTVTCQAGGGATIPTGAIWFFNLAACPSGWTAYAPGQGRYIVGVPSGGTLGATTGSALTNSENRPTGQHAHPITDPGHSHTINNIMISTGSSGFVPGGWGASTNAATTTTTTNITVNNSTGTSGVAGTNAPYVQLLICQKN